MARLIDADYTKMALASSLLNSEDRFAYVKAVASIDSTPTVDAVPVVRCRECKYHNKPRLGFCEMHLVRMNGSDFCSYGERKGGNE